MQAELKTTKIGLGGLATYFERGQQDKRTVLLVDHTGNAYTFFKYKARLIDCDGGELQVRTNYKKKQDIIQQVRKGLAFGIKQGQVVVLHFGSNAADWQQFFKDQKFWNLKKLLVPAANFDSEWYRSNVMKPDDTDLFGNKGFLVPSEKFLVMLSFTKDVELNDLKWLAGCQQNLQKVIIN